eukprot:tig00021352_g20704.t1
MFCRPSTIAVIGATERPGSVGRLLLWNLVSSPCGGTLFPINPNRRSVLGIKAYESVKEIPEPVELACIALPAPQVLAAVEQCLDAGVKGCIIVSSGFKEQGEAGAKLEQEIMARVRIAASARAAASPGAKRLAIAPMRILGPNSLGVMMPYTGLNASIGWTGMPRPGSVALVSQSGTVMNSLIDWTQRQQVGFSALISLGNMSDVCWSDVINMLGMDPHTRSILLYIESIGDTKAFMSAARSVAREKPIVVYKAGVSEAATSTAATHTGALVENNDVVDAALRRCGVLRVQHLQDLFGLSSALHCQPLCRGRRIAIVSNSGGPGIIATDALLAGGCEARPAIPPPRSAARGPTRRAAGESGGCDAGGDPGALPARWDAPTNPLIVPSDAGEEAYAAAVEGMIRDPGVDGLLVLVAAQPASDPLSLAHRIKPIIVREREAHAQGAVHATPAKPVIGCWFGGRGMSEGEQVLAAAGVPMAEFPDVAARVCAEMYHYSANLRLLYETPSLPLDTDSRTPDRPAVAALIRRAREEGRSALNEYESMAVLSAYGIPCVESFIARTADEAAAAARRIGFPVVVKLLSNQVSHKSARHGVRLHLHDEAAVRSAFAAIADLGGPEAIGVTVQRQHGFTAGAAGFEPQATCELIVGSKTDAQFGPVLLFGAGGVRVEVQRDKAVSLPPLNSTLARRMMERTRVYHTLTGGVRGSQETDVEGLVAALVAFSQLVVEQYGEIESIDANPLVVTLQDGALCCLDARICLHPPGSSPPPLAIRPFPRQYVSQFTLPAKRQAPAAGEAGAGAPAGEEGSRVGQPRGRPASSAGPAAAASRGPSSWLDGDLQVTLRPVRAEDEPLMVAFHSTLSERSVYFRYFAAVSLAERTSHDRLAKTCFIDYDRDMALAAIISHPHPDDSAPAGMGSLQTGVRGRAQSVTEDVCIGVARAVRKAGPLGLWDEAEVGVIISDSLQGRGLGRILMQRLIEVCRAEGLRSLHAEVLAENTGMRRIFDQLGFESHYNASEDVMHAALALA